MYSQYNPLCCINTDYLSCVVSHLLSVGFLRTICLLDLRQASLRFDYDEALENQLASQSHAIWQAFALYGVTALDRKVLDAHLGVVLGANETICFLLR